MCVFVLSIHNWQGNLRLTVWPATLRICVFICIFVFVLSIRNWHSREICGLLFGLPPRVNWSIIINTLTNVTQWLGELSTHSQWLGENGHSWRNRRRNVIISITLYGCFFGSFVFLQLITLHFNLMKASRARALEPKEENQLLFAVGASINFNENQPTNDKQLFRWKAFLYKTINNQSTSQPTPNNQLYNSHQSFGQSKEWNALLALFRQQTTKIKFELAQL